jgi:iron complex outermembrane receptor protein
MYERAGARVATAIFATLAAPGPALAQRATENAVTSSDDAFGTSIGMEQTGIYTENDTRGFSPIKAGNARIEGIYYDPVGTLPGRLRASTTIRVGFSALDYPFQAPTGIAEFHLRPMPDKRGLSLGYNRTAFGGVINEVDIRLPIIADHIGLTAGWANAELRQTDGSGNVSWGVTLRPIVRYGGIEVSPFLTYGRFIDNYTHPLVVVSDALPGFPKKHRFLGQRWARGINENNHRGVNVKASFTDSLSMRAGLFNSIGDRKRNFSEIFVLTAPSGLAVHRLIADPAQDIHSTSGEVQLAWRLAKGRWQHRFIAGFRARDRRTEFGGSDVRNFGLVQYGELDPEAQPDFLFSPVNSGHLHQSSWLFDYTGEIENLVTLNVGVQKAHYRASARDGRTGVTTTSRDNPWLYNATLSFALTHKLSIYVGTERGLEDSGAAPENAANRNAQLPATRTRQYEGGVRWIFPRGQLVVNAFQITKPYFSFDSANVFTELGDVRHRGIETSLSGRFGKRFTLVAGAVAMRPRVSGPAVDLGLIGHRPAGTPSLFARVDANYRTGIFGGLTPTASLIYTGKRAVGGRPLAALGGRQLMVPGAAIVDLGVRQQFKIGKIPASIRAVVNNVLDKATWKIVAANTLYVDERRRLTLTIAADF